MNAMRVPAGFARRVDGRAPRVGRGMGEGRHWRAMMVGWLKGGRNGVAGLWGQKRSKPGTRWQGQMPVGRIREAGLWREG